MPLEPGDAFVFNTKGVLINHVVRPDNIGWLTHWASHVGLRGLIYKVEDAKIFFIGADEKYYWFDVNASNKVDLVHSPEESKRCQENNNPPIKEELVLTKLPQRLIANKILSVQPMELPTGLLFYLDYTYGA